MRTKTIGVGLAIVFALASLSIAFADRPTPGAVHPERSITPPAQHGTPPAERGDNRHGISGTVTAKAGVSFTVSTKQGNEVVIVTADTKFRFPTKHNGTFADLAVGDRVAVNGTPSASGLVAKQVAVAPGKPTIQHRVGTVTAYTAGSSITIQDVRGGSETFTLTALTTIRNPKGSGVAVGDKVTVVSRRDPSSDTFTATAIVVHPSSGE